MLTSKHIFIVIILVTLKQAGALNESSQIEENEILRTKSIIGNITNKIFTSLKLKGIKEKPIVKHYSLIHSYFVSLTLQDHNNLKQIANYSRADKKIYNNKTFNNRFYDNRTDFFISQVIEILNNDGNKTEGNDSIDEVFPVFNYSDYIVTYINCRLMELEYHLHFYRGAKTPRLDINPNILALLNKEALALNNSDNLNDIFNFVFVKPELNRKDNISDKLDPFYEDSDTWYDPRVSGRRIFNGLRTKIKHFPFMVSIEIFNQFSCGGSILSEDFIITAASCLQLAWNNRFYRENPNFINARVGSKFYAGGGELISVIEIFFYPTYNPKTLNNNIALLRLSRKLKFKRKKKSKFKKVEFDKNESPLPIDVDGITIVGWGSRRAKDTVGGPWVNQLSYADLEVYPLHDCQDIYTKEYVTTKNFCAGFISKGTGACNKDIGGPGLVGGILTGIISFGSPKCGSPNSPTVFTKVGYYSDWIEEIIEKASTAPVVNRHTTLLTRPPQDEMMLTPKQTTTELTLTPIFETETELLHLLRYTSTDNPDLLVVSDNTTKRIRKDKHTKSKDDQFKKIAKPMFDSKEIADSLKLDFKNTESYLISYEKETEVKTEKSIKKQIPLVITSKPDLKLTSKDLYDYGKQGKKHRNKKNHSVIPIKIVNYNHKITDANDDLMDTYEAIMSSAMESSRTKTTKKYKKYKTTTVKFDKDFEIYENPIDYEVEQTKKLKKSNKNKSTTKKYRQTLKITPMIIKTEENNDMVYETNFDDLSFENEMTSSQENLLLKQIPPQEIDSYDEPGKQVLSKQNSDRKVIKKHKKYKTTTVKSDKYFDNFNKINSTSKKHRQTLNLTPMSIKTEENNDMIYENDVNSLDFENEMTSSQEKMMLKRLPTLVVGSDLKSGKQVLPKQSLDRQTIKKHKKYLTTTVQSDIDFENYDKLIDYETEQTKKHKKTAKIKSTTKKHRQTLKVTPMSIKTEENIDMIYENKDDNLDIEDENEMTSSQENILLKLLPTLVVASDLKPGKQVLPKQSLDRQTIKKHIKYQISTVKSDKYFENYEKPIDYQTKQTKNHKKFKINKYNTNKHRQISKVTPMRIKNEKNYDMVYENDTEYSDLENENEMTSNQEKMMLLHTQEVASDVVPGKKVLPKHYINKQVQSQTISAQHKLLKKTVNTQAVAAEALADQAVFNDDETYQYALNEPLAAGNGQMANDASVFDDNYYPTNGDFDLSIEKPNFGVKVNPLETKELEMDTKVNAIVENIDVILRDYILGPTFDDYDLKDEVYAIGDDVSFNNDMDREQNPMEKIAGL